jgi:hypothetical protein
VTLFSKRLPHVVTLADLAILLVPTYAGARDVDDEEALQRLTQALAVRGVADDLYQALSAGLRAAQGPRMTEDGLVDKLSAGLATRRSRVRPAPDSPLVAAVLVRIDLEIGVAAEQMRATLASPPGRAALEKGLAELGKHLVKELLK